MDGGRDSSVYGFDPVAGRLRRIVPIRAMESWATVPHDEVARDDRPRISLIDRTSDLADQSSTSKLATFQKRRVTIACRPASPHNGSERVTFDPACEELMSRLLRSRRGSARRQQVFSFLEQTRRRQRRFKQVIVLSTVLAMGALLAGSPRGRYLTIELAHR